MDVTHSHFTKDIPHENAEVNLNAYLTEEKAIQIMRMQLESSFPKVCATCHRSYATLFDYLSNTKQIGRAISYDVEVGNWEPLKPMGAMICSNCLCGNTIALTIKGMPLPLLWLLLDWVRVESLKREDPQTIFNNLLIEIRRQVLSDYDQENMFKKVVHQ
jgi:hypothetical protein